MRWAGCKSPLQGVDIRTVAELLGHLVIQQTMRYSHLAPEHKRDAVKKLAGFAPGRKKKDVVTSSHRTPEGAENQEPLRRPPPRLRLPAGTS
jgi:hypothetical protein